jgi:hypothetical protein
VADLPQQIDALIIAATELFQRKACIDLDGFTRKMITIIKRPGLVTLSGGVHKTLGDTSGPSKHIVDRCLARMMNWWRLAAMVLRTEFPDWYLLLQFQAFRVPRDLAITSRSRDQLQRLSSTFGLDPGQVLSEYEDLRPVASQLANQILANTAVDVSALAWQKKRLH